MQILYPIKTVIMTAGIYQQIETATELLMALVWYQQTRMVNTPSDGFQMKTRMASSTGLPLIIMVTGRPIKHILFTQRDRHLVFSSYKNELTSLTFSISNLSVYGTLRTVQLNSVFYGLIKKLHGSHGLRHGFKSKKEMLYKK